MRGRLQMSEGPPPSPRGLPGLGQGLWPHTRQQSLGHAAGGWVRVCPGSGGQRKIPRAQSSLSCVCSGWSAALRPGLRGLNQGSPVMGMGRSLPLVALG